MMELTIEITQFCREECDYCSTNASPNGEHLSLDRFIDIIHDIEKSDKVIERINISGGEPLSHPDFFAIKEYCDQLVGRENVYVYTNAISNLVYNTNVLRSGVTVHANVILIPGREAYIPSEADVTHLLKLVKQGRAKDINVPDLEFHLSGSKPGERCNECNHLLIQADGRIMMAPCKKDYDRNEG